MNKSVQYGVIAALVSIILNVISLLFFSNEMIEGKVGISSVFQFLSFVVLVVFMVKAVKDVRDEQNGFIRFKEALKPSFTVGAIWSVLNFILGILFQKVIFKSIYDRVFEVASQKQITQMEENGLSEEMIESTMQMTEKIQSMAVYFTLPVILVVTFILALIISAILKRKNPSGFA